MHISICYLFTSHRSWLYCNHSYYLLYYVLNRGRGGKPALPWFISLSLFRRLIFLLWFVLFLSGFDV